MRSSVSFDKQYKLLLEVLPRWAIVALFCVFIFAFSFLGIVVGLFAPSPYTTMERDVQLQSDRLKQDFYEAMAGIDPTEIRLNSVDRFHSEILFYMRLYPEGTYIIYTFFNNNIARQEKDQSTLLL